MKTSHRFLATAFLVSLFLLTPCASVHGQEFRNIANNFQGSYRTYQNKIGAYTAFPFQGDHMSPYYNVLRSSQILNPYRQIRYYQSARQDQLDNRSLIRQNVNFQPLVTSHIAPPIAAGGYLPNATGHVTRFMTYQRPVNRR